jgi:hypothetical protein
MGASAFLVTFLASKKPLADEIRGQPKSSFISFHFTREHTLPGAPDGEYVVIQYQTAFQNKKSAIETVTPMLDKDGHWRVAGYYIK